MLTWSGFDLATEMILGVFLRLMPLMNDSRFMLNELFTQGFMIEELMIIKKQCLYL